MCAECGRFHDTMRPGKSARLRLWEFPDQAHCPVIGTCLSDADLLRIAKGLRLVFDKAARDYDVHGYFVRAATMDSPEARAVTKLLDARHSGSLRLVGREHAEDALLALWEQMKANGQIAGGFWAFMTYRHVPAEVRGHIFGEVHMLSHLMGASCRAHSAESSSLKQELADLQKRRERTEAGLHEKLGERDRAIEALRAEVTVLTKRLAEQEAARAAPRAALHRTKDAAAATGKLERALAVARGRARAAEAENARLRAAGSASEARRAAAATAAADAARVPLPGQDMAEAIRIGRRLTGRSFLYVGGRNGQVPHLQKVAETFGAALLHHDGGQEDAITRIDDVLPSVDCVLCPIDCVSHDACLRAKQGCKRLGKSFVPLRSASKACLRHALIAMMADQDPARAQ